MGAQGLEVAEKVDEISEKVFSVNCDGNPFIPSECQRNVQYEGTLEGIIEFRMEDLFLVPADEENSGEYLDLPAHFLDFFEKHPELLERIPAPKNSEGCILFRGTILKAKRGANLFAMLSPGKNGRKWERGICAVKNPDLWDCALVMKRI